MTRAASAAAPLRVRDTPEPEDPARVEALVAATGFFSPEEIAVARDLVEERLGEGLASGYHFVFASRGSRLAGYTCFGPVPATASSFDLYWIAVDPADQGQGVGRALMRDTEGRIAALGGTRVYADTSGRAQYAPTRAFYERAGYTQAALLEDFFAPGDAKVIYVRVLGAPIARP
ncbi:MAG: GNAT family N-acetyltransferase [Myxococcales bacterium]|nr:GNAT family N-acetyltransferase [Myxococcales bacterium]